MAVSYCLSWWGRVGWGVDTRHSDNKLWWVLYIRCSKWGVPLWRKILSLLSNRWNLIEWFCPFSITDLKKPLRCISAWKFWTSDTWMKETSSCDFPVKSLYATWIASDFAILDSHLYYHKSLKSFKKQEETPQCQLRCINTLYILFWKVCFTCSFINAQYLAQL